MKNLLIAVILLVPAQLFAQSTQQNVVVVFDDSSSMGNYLGNNLSRMEAAKQSLRQVLQVLPSNTNIGIVLLNGQWEEKRWFVPFAVLDKNSIDAKVASLRESGGTPLGGCMKAACDVLLQKRSKQRYGSYKMIIVTDGEASDPYAVEKYTPDIMKRGITVDVIGVGMNGEHTLATKVSSYKKADDPKQLATALQSVFAEVSYKDKASADEDFAMLQAMPDNLPLKIIDAFLDSGNHPIGEEPKLNSQSSNQSLPTYTNGNFQTNTTSPLTFVGVALGIFLIFIIVIVLLN